MALRAVTTILYRCAVTGLRDISFGETIKVYRAGPDGKPAEFLRTESPTGKPIRSPRRAGARL